MSEELHSESSSKKASCKEETSVSSTTMGQKLSKALQNSTESVTMITSEIKSNDSVDVKESEVEVNKCENVSYDEICDKDMGEKLVYCTNSSETGISEKDPSAIQENRSISATLASENILDGERIVDEKNLDLNGQENMNDSITANLKNKENVSPSGPEQEMEVDDAAILDYKKEDQVMEKFQDEKIKIGENQLLKADPDDTEILDIDDSVLDKGKDDDKETEAEKLGKQILSLSVTGIKKINASNGKIEYDSKIELDEKLANMETNPCTSKEEYIDLDDIEADTDLRKDKKSEIVKNNCEKAEDVQTHDGNFEDKTELLSEAEDMRKLLMRKRSLSGSPTPVAKKPRLDELLANLSERTGSPKDLSPEAESTESESECETVDKKMITVSTVDLKTLLRLKLNPFKTTEGTPMRKSVDEMQKKMSIFETSLKAMENQVAQTATSWLKRIGRKQAVKRKEKQLAAIAAQEASTVAKSQAAQSASTVGKSQSVSQNAQHVSESVMVTTVNQQRISNTLTVTQLATIATSLATSQPTTFVSVPGSQNVALISQQQLQALQTATILQKPRTTLTTKGSTVLEMLETQQQQNGATSAIAKKGRMTIDLTEEDEASPRKHSMLSLVQQQGLTTLASIQPAANIRPGTVLLQGTPSSAGAVLLGVQGVRAPSVVYASQPRIVHGQLVTDQRPLPPLQPSSNAMTLNNPPKGVASSTAHHLAPSSSPDLIVTKCDIPAPGTCHPAPLPPLPKLPSNQPAASHMKSLPPKPCFKINRVQQGLVLSWNMTLSDQHAPITNYELYAYQERSAPPTVNLWKKVGDIKALPLPMACTLTQFQVGSKYHFAVRAKDHHSRVGSFSDACSIHLE